MIDYTYTAKDRETGEIKKGKISADSKNSAASILDEKNLYPITIEDAKKSQSVFKKNVFGTSIKTKDRVIFTRQLATLVKAGLPITQALNTAIEQMENPAFKQILLKIAASVEGGQSLSASFAQYPKVFNNIYISLFEAGEQSGNLDESLIRLADQQEKDQQVIRKVRGALIYPAVVLSVIEGVVIFMVTTVLPQVGSLYKDLGVKLPLLTSVLLSSTNFMIKFWYLIILVIVLIFFGIRAYVHTPRGKRNIDVIKMKIPVFGILYKKLYAARLTRTLSSLVNSGVPLIKSIRIAGQAVDNLAIKEIVDNAAERVKTGESLSSSLRDHDEILKLVPQMIEVGEESGSLGSMLEKVANLFEDEVDQTVKNLSEVIEPFMIIILGVAVVVIVVAVLYPIYGLATSINSTGGSGSGL